VVDRCFTFIKNPRASARLRSFMALTKDKKNEVVAEVAALLGSSKMTVVTKYEGTTVKALQESAAKAATTAPAQGGQKPPRSQGCRANQRTQGC
jgi:hypothetical protein